MDDKENPYIIKVLTFDHKAEAADFMNRVEQIKKLNTSYLPTIEECVLDPNTYQVTIVEHFVSGISLKKIYEEMLTKKHLILKVIFPSSSTIQEKTSRPEKSYSCTE